MHKSHQGLHAPRPTFMSIREDCETSTTKTELRLQQPLRHLRQVLSRHLRLWTYGDAEHPTTIPMDATSTIQAPSGPMTRARARAIQSEVTSLLLEFSPSSSETWLLPKSEIPCDIRYNSQDSEPRTIEEEKGVNTLDSPELPAPGPSDRPGASSCR